LRRSAERGEAARKLFARPKRAAGEAASAEAMIATSAKRGATSAIAAASSMAPAASTAASAGTSPSAASAGHQTALPRSGASACSVCDCSTSVRDRVP